MASALRPRGVFVPLVTPFTEHDVVDLPALEALASDALSAGAAGLIALATTGEPTSLDDAERDAVVSTIARACADGGGALMVGAGTNDTRTTIARHEALAQVPAVAAALAVVPYYVRPSEAAIVRHFQVVAERSPVPLVIYNIPYRTGRGLGASALLELAATDNVAGVKQAVGGIDADTLEVLAGAGDDFVVMGGDDAFLYPLVLMGGSGAVAASAHLCTERFVQMIECGLEGRVAEGRAHAEALLPLVRWLFAEPSPAPVKAVLHAQGRIPTPHVRMPLGDASAEVAARAISGARPAAEGQAPAGTGSPAGAVSRAGR
ncbi:MAG: 4-hydroxy-tetrahydrodipicolinate synthase [Thermoleophilaceae bacterium]|nr:4-hydroxy-tetrahydrodipicolinate synthase [Thermoleophilaceae bacterium]